MNPKRILFISNMADRVGSFSIASIYAAHSLGYTFHLAGNYDHVSKKERNDDERIYDVGIHHINLSRSPFSLRNIGALREVVALIKQEKVDYIHCNTPVGGILGRLAGCICGVKKIIYEAHGFHFYQGAPKLNWLLYYPIEKILTRLTDAIITINQEDYQLALEHLHPRDKIYYVPGVGIDLSVFSQPLHSREEVRSSLGLKNNDIVFLAVGRLEQNKNVGTLIRALAMVKDTRAKLILCGDGELRKELEDLVSQLDVQDRVSFLGNRSDMVDIYHAVDCFVMASYREGLSRSIMEAMACGLPCIVSKIRGNVDLIDEAGGYLCSPDDTRGYAMAMDDMLHNDRTVAFQAYNVEKVKQFSLETVTSKLTEIYQQQFGGT